MSTEKLERLYTKYFRILKFVGIFPYTFDRQNLQLKLNHKFSDGIRLRINILIAIAIFSKQTCLLFHSFLYFKKEEIKDGSGRPDVMFRTMWFFGSLFLNSMFFLHVFKGKAFATAVTSWLQFEHRTIESARTWNVRLTERHFSRCLKLYTMMWICSSSMMGSLYAWNPAFFPFFFSLIHNYITGQSLKWFLVVSIGIFELYFIMFAMTAMAGFDIILGFFAMSVRKTLVEVELTAALTRGGRFAKRHQWQDPIRSYKALQCLTGLMNKAYSSSLLIHFGTVFLMIPFFIYGVEHYAISVQTTMFFFWCIAFQLVRIASLWIPLGLIEYEAIESLKRMKSHAGANANGAILRREIRHCKPFALNAGGVYDITVNSILRFIHFSTMNMVAFIG